MASTKHNFRIKNGLEVGNELIVNGITIVNSEGVLQNPAGYNNSNWDTAFGWGNHASAGYLTSFDITSQTDPKYLRSNANDTKTGNLILQTSGASTNTATGLLFETGGTYSDGRWRTRFRKQDKGGGIPLYIDTSSATANVYTETVRIGTYSGNSYEVEVFGDINATGNLYDGGNAVWHVGNDGSGSGLDADLLDGQHGSYYRPRADSLYYKPTREAAGSYLDLNAATTPGIYRLHGAANHNGHPTGSGYGFNIVLDNSDVHGHILLDRLDGGTMHIRAKTGTTWTTAEWNKVWTSGNDGSGSGLDADLLDGQHGSYYYSAANPPPTYSKYLRSDTADTASGLITFTSASGIKYSGEAASPLWLHRNSGTNVNIRLSSSIGTTYVGQGAASGTLEIGTTADLLGTGQRVFADNYHPNADKWTTPRSHTVTLTGGVTGTASQNVDGTGNRTWTIATTVASISAPSAPSITATSVVGETIEITFSQSSTSNVDLYEVWSDGATGSDYSLIARVPEDDVAASMSIIDSSFDSGGTVAYRVYAIKEGVYSTAATATRAFTVPTNLDVTSLSVIANTNVYHINYNKPDSRFVDHIEIYKDVEAIQASLSRTGASLIYSGDNSSFTYSIAASDLDNYHQFWVEVVTV